MKAGLKRGAKPSTGIGAGILASALLSLLTISVFFVLRDYGPESAIRKYNEAIINGDSFAVDQLSTQPQSTREGAWMRDQVRTFIAAGGRLRLEQMQRNPGHDYAFVIYAFPDRPPIRFLFVVTKENHIWKVNPLLTERAIARVMGYGE